MRWVCVVALASGCYSPTPVSPCSVTCSASEPCPDGLTCGPDNLCHDGDQTCFDRCAPQPVLTWRYRFYDNGANWFYTDAVARCGDLGMVVATIDSADEESYLETLLPAVGAAWIANHRIGTSDMWEGDGCPAMPGFKAGEGTFADQGCALLYNDGAADTTCDWMLDRLALCEMARPGSSRCGAAFDPGRYRVLTNADLRGIAAASCDRPGEHLVTIETLEEQLAVDVLAGPRYWVDGTFTNGSWTTATGCPSWFDWGPAQPELATGNSAIRDGGVTRTAGASEVAIAVCETD